MSIRSLKENIVEDTFPEAVETSGRSLMQSLSQTLKGKGCRKTANHTGFNKRF